MIRSLAVVAALLAVASAAHVPEPKSVAEYVIANKDNGFGVLLEAVLAADKSILETLSDPSLKATVFAPTDKAFRRLLKQLHISKSALLKNKPLLDAVLTYHVLGTPVRSTDLKIRQFVQTLLPGKNGELKITKKPRHGETVVRLYTTSDGTAKVIAADVKAGKSVIHAINRVLIPKI